MATISLTRSWSSFGARKRRALTLIEIMASILVLAVGLVGVLAAIPFGGMRMAQMNEADNSSVMGRNAVRLMKFNGWADPKNWYLTSAAQTGVPFSNTDNRALRPDGSLNLTYPYFVDPLAYEYIVDPSYTIEYPQGYLFPSFCQCGASGVFFTRVAPAYDFEKLGFSKSNAYYARYLGARYERDFYLHNAVNGYTVAEDESHFRPRVETEDNWVYFPNNKNFYYPSNNPIGSGEIDSFDGRCSWLATVTLKSSSDPSERCRLSNLTAADYDVVVFQDRVFNDEKVFTGKLEGSGYQGGVVVLDLNTGFPDNDGIARNRFVEQLETTRYIMLFGWDDVSGDGGNRVFAKWYKIANYSVVESDNDGAPTLLRLSLIGENTPTCWAEGASDISALFFPGAVGVYSGTTPL